MAREIPGVSGLVEDLTQDLVGKPENPDEPGFHGPERITDNNLHS
jgi:hypothetical protein